MTATYIRSEDVTAVLVKRQRLNYKQE